MDSKIIFLLIVSLFALKINGKVVGSNCTSSGAYFKNLQCEFKTDADGRTLVTIGFEILKKIKSVYVSDEISKFFYSFFLISLPLPQVSFYMLSKNGPKWNEVMKYEKIDACMSLSIAKKLPVLGQIVDAYMISFPTFPHSCPIQTGRYLMENLETSQFDGKVNNVNENIFRLKLLKGLYKIRVIVWNLEDPNLYTLEWQNDLP